MKKRVFTSTEIKNQNIKKYNKRKKIYRRHCPEYRKQARQKYYDKTKIRDEATRRRPTGIPHRIWTDEECKAILSWDMCTDREIGKHLNRSVHAIQQKRHILLRNSGMKTLQKTGKITHINLPLKIIRPLLEGFL